MMFSNPVREMTISRFDSVHADMQSWPGVEMTYPLFAYKDKDQELNVFVPPNGNGSIVEKIMIYVMLANGDVKFIEVIRQKLRGLKIIVNRTSVEAPDEWQVLRSNNPGAEIDDSYFICTAQVPGNNVIREAALHAACSFLLFSDASQQNNQETVCSTLMLTRESHGEEAEVFEDYAAVLENEASADA